MPSNLRIVALVFSLGFLGCDVRQTIGDNVTDPETKSEGSDVSQPGLSQPGLELSGAGTSDAGSDTTNAPVTPLLSVRIGVFRQGEWIIDSNDNLKYDATDKVVNFGGVGETPIVGDWTGTGVSRVGVSRPSAGGREWFLDLNNDGIYSDTSDRRFFFGNATDTPIVGDWAGLGRSCIGVFRAEQPNNGSFSLDYDGDNIWNPSTDKYFRYGLSQDRPVVGDWAGLGRTSVGIMRPLEPNNAWWDLDADGNQIWNPANDRSISYGLKNDFPIPADWTKSGRASLGIFRDGGWVIDINGDGQWDTQFSYGMAGDIPVVFNR